MAKATSSPKKESSKKETSKKPRSKKVLKPAAKSLRDHTLAPGLDKRLVPSSVKRTTKEPARFTESSEHKEEKEIVIPKGKGKKLGDIEHIAAQINKRTRSDELLKLIHGTLLGKVTKKVEMKENLAAFCGVVYEDNKKGRINLENRLNTILLKPLRQINAFFGLSPEGVREDVVGRLADWLEKPKDTGETFEVPGEKTKRKRSSSRSRSRSSSPAKKKQKKKKDPNAPKRPTTAFFFFSGDRRDALRKKYPKEGVADIAKRLGEKWRKMSKEEKKEFEEKSGKDKQRYEKEMKKYEGGKK